MRTILALLILSWATVSQGHAEVLGANHWYSEMASGKWCAYRSQGAWMRSTAYVDASARIVAGKVQAIEIFSSDETGDWAVADTYAVKDGEISGLDRYYNSFNYSRFHARYVRRNGRLVRTARRFETEDGKAENPKDHAEPADGGAYLPVYSHLETLPFFRVVFENPKSGKACKPVTPNNPATPQASTPPAQTAEHRP